MTLTDDLDTLEWQRRRTAQLSGDPDATTNQLNDDLPADVWQRLRARQVGDVVLGALGDDALRGGGGADRVSSPPSAPTFDVDREFLAGEEGRRAALSRIGNCAAWRRSTTLRRKWDRSTNCRAILRRRSPVFTSSTEQAPRKRVRRTIGDRSRPGIGKALTGISWTSEITMTPGGGGRPSSCDGISVLGGCRAERGRDPGHRRR